VPKKKKPSDRKVGKVLHIYCEGEKTEPIYINKYIEREFAGQKGRKVIRVEPTKKNTPVQLVDVAVAHKKRHDCPEGDEFWVVYDRERIAKYPHELHANARNKANVNGVKIAFSNICFELWLLLHLTKSSAAYADCDDLLANSQFKKLLAERGLARYDKGCAAIFEVIRNDIDRARERASDMNDETKSNAPKGVSAPHMLNPYTDMHLLLDAIDKFKP